jgi:hypothetical protein
MTDQDNTPNELEDVEGHRRHFVSADAESAEGDTDTEGHRLSRLADAESAEGDDDTEGHGRGRWADAESAEGDDDVAGHVYIENRDDLNQQRLR